MFVDFFIDYIGPPQLCSLLRVDEIILEDIVQSPLNMCPYGVYSLILTEPHTDQTQGSDQEEEPNNTHIP